MSDEPCVRFFELRYEGDRMLRGVALRYGDTAELPWGKERFEPGAFGEMGGVDAVLNFQHDRGRPLARTSGGGLSLRDSVADLRVEADLPTTSMADDALELVKTRVLRGFSIEFYPRESRFEDDVEVIERAELVAVAVVDTPAYAKSVIERASQRRQSAEQRKDEPVATLTDEVKAAIREAVTEAVGDGTGTVDPEAIAETLGATLGETVRSEIASALEERDAAKAATEKAEAERAAAEAKAAEDRATIEADAEARADLIASVRELLPEGFDPKGKDRHAILVAAVGTEVADADKRSADYLDAKVEAILERREAAERGRPQPTPPKGGPGDGPAMPVNVIRMVEQRRRPSVAATDGK